MLPRAQKHLAEAETLVSTELEEFFRLRTGGGRADIRLEIDVDGVNGDIGNGDDGQKGNRNLSHAAVLDELEGNVHRLLLFPIRVQAHVLDEFPGSPGRLGLSSTQATRGPPMMLPKGSDCREEVAASAADLSIAIYLISISGLDSLICRLPATS